jgi:hypothetical protein
MAPTAADVVEPGWILDFEEADMGHLVLLGDSVFDNAAYIGGGPAVIDQVRQHLPEGWRATLLAVDGSTTPDVDRQLERMPADASHLVLSVGGNDALGEIGVLQNRVRSIGEALGTLADIQGRFVREYIRLLRAITALGRSTVVCTIYNPRYAEPNLQRIAMTALALFNDVILRTALATGTPVLELRSICTADEDYANPIEPSTIGGEKLARAICDVATRHDFARRQTVLFPMLPDAMG